MVHGKDSCYTWCNCENRRERAVIPYSSKTIQSLWFKLVIKGQVEPKKERINLFIFLHSYDNSNGRKYENLCDRETDGMTELDS